MFYLFTSQILNTAGPFPPPIFTSSPPSSTLKGCPTPGFPSTLEFQVSTGLCASSPIEDRQCSSLLYMCQGPYSTHPPICFLVRGTIFQSSQHSRLVDTVVLPMGLPSPSVNFKHFPNSFIVDLYRNPLLDCQYLYYFQCRAFQRIGWLRYKTEITGYTSKDINPLLLGL